LSTPALADGDGSLGEALNQDFWGGGALSFGAGMRTAIDASATQPVTFTVSGVPSDAEVAAAWLYVVEMTNDSTGGDGSYTFAGSAVTGTLAGTHDGTCWSVNYNHTYRVDVTSLVTGDGDYDLEGVEPTGSSDVAQGASLVVIYQQADTGTVTRVVVNDGAVSGNASNEVMSTSLTNFTVPETPSDASFHMAMGDGQTFADNAVTLNGTSVIAASSFNGATAAAGTTTTST